MYSLAKLLKIRLPEAVGIMEMLWHHANQHTPQGDIGSLPDEAVAEAVAWDRKPEILIDALVSSRWIERNEEFRLILHDWPDHCEQSSVKWLEYNHKSFLPIYGVSLENRKRISRKSPAPREAMAMAMALDDSKKENQEADFSFEETFERLYAAHPKKEGKILAEQALAVACEPPADVGAILAKIEAAHALWLPEFKRAGKFAPQLHRWISDQKYLDDPPATEEEYSVIANLRKAVGG
jgi:hypothetical protein